MKLVLGTTLVLLLAGAPIYAGQEPDKDKPKEEPKKEAPKKNEGAKKNEAPARQEDRKPEERSKQEPANSRPAQQNDRTQQQQQQERTRTEQHPAQQPERAQEQQRAQQTEQHRDNDRAGGGGHSRRVPEAQFHEHFGAEHHFHVQRSNDRRFSYGGYYFTYQEVWPSDWDYNDDVYIEEIDGEYYLINPRHPGIRLLVIIAD
jgi:hypothetical protein